MSWDGMQKGAGSKKTAVEEQVLPDYLVTVSGRYFQRCIIRV